MGYAYQRPTSPAAALSELLAGNDRFVGGTRVHPNQDAEHRAALAAEQRPFAVVFGCSDSRLAAEIIFDRGLGDLFVVRTAGHVVGPEVLASIEYGVAVLGTPLVVILGHDSCGAITATLAAADGESPVSQDLNTIIDRIMPSLKDADTAGVRDTHSIAEFHVRRTLDLLINSGTSIGTAIEAGRCGVVGMSYRLAEGRVSLVASSPGELAG